MLGLRIELAPFGSLPCYGASACRRFKGAILMCKENLGNIIAVLKKLRDAHCSQLDASTLAELEDVIQQLCRHRDSSIKIGIRFEGRIFRIINVVISLVTDINDWIK